jgi:hypothetical protein
METKMRILLICLGALCLPGLLSGCPSKTGGTATTNTPSTTDSAQATPAASAAQVPADGNQQPQDLAVAATAPDNMGGLAMPDNWPAGLQQYPGSQPLGSKSAVLPEGVSTTVILTTKDDAKQVLAYFDKTALEANFTVSQAVSEIAGVDALTAEYAKEPLHFRVTAYNNASPSGTQIELVMLKLEKK